MSFENCINENDKLTKKQKARLVDNYKQLKKKYSASMNDMDAAAVAAEKFVSMHVSEITRKKINTLKDILHWEENLSPEIKSLNSKFEKEKEQASFGKILFGDSYTRSVINKLESVFTRNIAVEREFMVQMSEALDAYGSKFAGLKQDVDGFERVTREILGENTGDDAAKEAGRSISKVFDLMHSRYKSAGGILGKIEKYFPQINDPIKVGRSSFEEWRDFILPKLDLDRMIDVETGLPMTLDRIEELLPDIFESIKTNGLNEVMVKAESGGQLAPRRGSAAFSTRRAYSRFFHFKDADSYLAYNEKFGYGKTGLYDAMIGHIHSMSRDITLMEELGPKPEAVINRYLLNIDARGGSGIGVVNSMWNVLAGKTSFNGQVSGFYRSVENLQNWLRSTLLGSAPVSAMSDSVFGSFASKMNGIPVTGFLREYGRLMNPLNESDRRIARRNVAISGSINGASIRHAMDADDANKGAFSFLASFTNRASGLGIMTDNIKQASMLGASGHMAEMSHLKTSWAELDQPLKDSLSRFNMDESDYNNIINSQSSDIFADGSDFILPENIYSSGFKETAVKYGNWLIDISQTASNEPRLLTRAITTAGMKKGTLGRAAITSVMMFKSFAITVALNHTIPALRHMSTARGLDRMSRIGSLLVAMPIMGAFVMQSKNVLNGKEPQEMNAKFWKASLMQSGGLGVLGDFIFADYSRFNQNLGTTISGPVVGFANDIFRVFMGNFDRSLKDGEDTKFMTDLFQFAKKNIPGVKLWYTKLLMERLLLDNAERMIDPMFDIRMNRIEQRMQKETGNRFYWEP